MKRRELLTMTAMSPWLGACAGTPGGAGGSDVRGIGMVVEDSLAYGASEKKGVMGFSDTGRQLFAHAGLTARGGGTSGSGGATIPRWVRVTWREGPGIDMDWKTGGWVGGTVVGDYTVPVLERIPPQAFDLARAGKKRPLVLRFRIRDDGVDFGWMVRLQDGVPFEELMRGGDF